MTYDPMAKDTIRVGLADDHPATRIGVRQVLMVSPYFTALKCLLRTFFPRY